MTTTIRLYTETGDPYNVTMRVDLVDVRGMAEEAR